MVGLETTETLQVHKMTVALEFERIFILSSKTSINLYEYG